MKKVEKVVLLLSVGCCLALLTTGCNSSMSARAYQGEPQPLEEVAVLLSNPHTCPVFTIDGKHKDLKRKPGTEIHVLPGTHEIEVFYQAEGSWISPFEIERTTLTQNFQAGRVVNASLQRIAHADPSCSPQFVQNFEPGMILASQAGQADFSPTLRPHC